jgi:hypothetical protein
MTENELVTFTGTMLKLSMRSPTLIAKICNDIALRIRHIEKWQVMVPLVGNLSRLYVGNEQLWEKMCEWMCQHLS